MSYFKESEAAAPARRERLRAHPGGPVREVSVVRDDRLVGLITCADIVRALAEKP